MAFTTTTGSGGTSLIGTSGVDTVTISSPIAGRVFIGAQGDNDIVNLAAALGAVSNYSANLGSGNDILNAASSVANSSFLADDGDDNLTFASVSTSTVSGLNGIDTINLTTAGSAITTSLINGNSGNDIVNVGGGVAVTVNATTIAGGSGNDVITVNTVGANVNGSKINGQEGDDTLTVTSVGANMTNATIFGGNGNDTINSAAAQNVILSGDLGNDVITSGAGNDTVFGGEGADLITTAGGFDSMSGGNGVDTFTSTIAAVAGSTQAFAGTVTAGDIIGAAGTNFDVITDFTAGVGQDRLDLAAVNTINIASIGTAAVFAGAQLAISGTFNSNGTFTVGATNTAGADTLVLVAAAATYNTALTGIVLRNVNASQLVASQVV